MVVVVSETTLASCFIFQFRKVRMVRSATWCGFRMMPRRFLRNRDGFNAFRWYLSNRHSSYRRQDFPLCELRWNLQ